MRARSVAAPKFAGFDTEIVDSRPNSSRRIERAYGGNHRRNAAAGPASRTVSSARSPSTWKMIVVSLNRKFEPSLARTVSSATWRSSVFFVPLITNAVSYTHLTLPTNREV